MRFDPDACSLSFASPSELQAFHDELSTLVRAAMVGATRHIADSDEAKKASQSVMRELRVSMRALNVMRAKLPRKTF
jgi:hypothetical protein